VSYLPPKRRLPSQGSPKDQLNYSVELLNQLHDLLVGNYPSVAQPVRLALEEARRLAGLRDRAD
jgi:hypothetical protein